MKPKKYRRGPLLTNVELYVLHHWNQNLNKTQGVPGSLMAALELMLVDSKEWTYQDPENQWGLTSLTNSVRSLVAHIGIITNTESPYEP